MSASSLSEPFREFLRESRAVLHLRVDGRGAVLAVNRALANLLGDAPEAFVGRPAAAILLDHDPAAVAGWISPAGPPARFFAGVRTPHHGAVVCRFTALAGEDAADLVGEPQAGTGEAAIPALVRLNNELAVLTREHARRGRELEEAKRQIEATLEERDRSYWHLRKIQEVLPICMECGRVKTGDADWESVVEYLKKNSLFLSHGYCPDCVQRVRARHRAEREAGG